ncbi:hypothetical protein HK105_207452, partial [Polyrhizophydium stewartii]
RFKQHKKRFPALQSPISVVYAHYAAQLGESAPEQARNRFEGRFLRPILHAATLLESFAPHPACRTIDLWPQRLF